MAASAPDDDGSRTARLLVRAIALGAAYAVLSWSVQAVTAFGDETSSSVFWPAAGVTLAVLLRRPRREWPALLAAVWIAETALDLHNGFTPAVSVAWGFANAAEPLVAASLLTRSGRERPDLTRRGDLLRFVLFGVLVGPLLGASIGAASSVWFAGDVWWPRLPRWFVGDAVGALTIAPALLVTTRPRFATIPRSVVPWLILVATIAIGLAPWSPSAEIGLPYLVLAALVLVALQVGGRASTGAILLVAVVVEVSTASSTGPFAERNADTGLVEAQMFLAMGAFSCLAITALMTDLVDRERAAAELLSQTLHDDLTGLANRRHLVSHLRHVSDRMRHEDATLALLFIDLDGFKSINDRFGHLAGDELLRSVARRLLTVVREGDTVARLGGDEFVVASEQCDTRGDAERLAARLESIIAVPFRWRHHQLRVGASIGVLFTNHAITDIEGFLDEADRAMYQQKIRRTAEEGRRLGQREPSGQIVGRDALQEVDPGRLGQ